MKTPQFEELADRWGAHAEFAIVFSREAHPGGRGGERLARAADRVASWDADGDGFVTRAEFQGPAMMFSPFDVDGDDRISAPELLSGRRVDEFGAFEAPTSYAERVATVDRYRAECPGDVPVLVDTMDDAARAAWGGRPNSAFIVGTDGRIAGAFEWASARAIDGALRELIPAARHPPALTEPVIDWGPLGDTLDRARAEGRDALVTFSAPGCAACVDMKAGTLADPGVVAALGAFTRAELGVEVDVHWALFDALGLNGTPAYVVVRDGAVVRRREGRADVDTMLAFLRGAS